MRLALLFSAFFSSAVYASDVFDIPPHLTTLRGQSIFLSWSYKPEFVPPDNPVVKYMEKYSLHYLPSEQDGELFSAVIPPFDCDTSSPRLYQVPGMDKPAHVTPIPCAESDGTARFVFLADTQEGYDIDAQFAKRISEFGGSAVLHGGDLVQTGQEYEEWRKFFTSMDKALREQTLFPVVGNHEYRFDSTMKLWKHFFKTKATDYFYSSFIGPVRVIGLNSGFEDDPTLRFKQVVWLLKELGKPATWTIVMYHHPAFSSGLANSSSSPWKEWQVLQEDFVPLFEEFNVNLVLNGHTHIFEHSLKSGVHYLTMGAAGGKVGQYGPQANPFGLQTSKDRTIAQIQATHRELLVQTVTLEGLVLNEIRLSKPNP